MPFLPIFKPGGAQTFTDLPTVRIKSRAYIGGVTKIRGLPTAGVSVSSLITHRGVDVSKAIIRYFCEIDGSADGLDDIMIPISSFQSRRRSGKSTYLSVVIPTIDYADEITARANGDMIVFMAYEYLGELLQKEEIVRTDIETVQVYSGPTSKSVTLIGYKYSVHMPKTVFMPEATYKSVINGRRRYRIAKPNIFLNPGDTVEIGDESLEVGVISYVISEKIQQIEIEEKLPAA